MFVRDVMTQDPVCCTPHTSLREAARLMAVHQFGSLPVVNHLNERALLGVITDRDILCRSLAEGKDPTQLTVRDCMTANVVAVTPAESLHQSCVLMEENQVRRLPVIDPLGRCIGIVTQADLARKAPAEETLAVVAAVSRPTDTPSRVAATAITA